MESRSIFVVMILWQIATAQENCPPGLKIAAGLDTLLGNVPISSCAPDLPALPSLPCDGGGYGPELPNLPCLPGGLDGLLGSPCSDRLPELPCGGLPELPCSDRLPELPCLPAGDCGYPSLPSLPPLAGFGDCYDYPFFDEPLPYLKKKGCCLEKSLCARKRYKECGCAAKERGCGCFARECGLKKSCLKEKEDLGVGLKIVPLIKPFPLKSKSLGCGSIETLPCEVPSLVSDVFRGSLAGSLAGCY